MLPERLVILKAGWANICWNQYTTDAIYAFG
ncbi:hypothetical protein [Escherichia phage UPEC06]|nr:hypothetical protein [Escherichia phage UPEC06]